QQDRQRDEPRKNSNSEGNPAAKNFLPALSRLLDKAEDLERDHRQDARHQIQNDHTEKSNVEKRKNSVRRRRTTCRYSRRPRNLPSRAIIAVRSLRENYEP